MTNTVLSSTVIGINTLCDSVKTVERVVNLISIPAARILSYQPSVTSFWLYVRTGDQICCKETSIYAHVYDQKFWQCWYNGKVLELSLFYIFENIIFKHEIEISDGISQCLSNEKAGPANKSWNIFYDFVQFLSPYVALISYVGFCFGKSILEKQSIFWQLV